MKDGVPILPAATVMILREARRSLEVLLLRRNTALKFAPGFWVFPGGKIDRKELEGQPTIEHSARKAAVRETIEESGLLVRTEDLHHYCHWTTPAGGPRRFGTWFFHTRLEDGYQDIVIDGEEIIDHMWLSAEDALQILKRNRLPMLPPTIISLNRIKPYTSYGDVTAEFKRTGILTVVPEIDRRKDVIYSLYPGDAGYTKRDASLPGPRHRLVFHLNPMSYKFEYSGCSQIPPVSGGIPL